MKQPYKETVVLLAGTLLLAVILWGIFALMYLFLGPDYGASA